MLAFFFARPTAMSLKKGVFQASITCPKEQVIFVLGDDVLGLQRGYFFT